MIAIIYSAILFLGMFFSGISMIFFVIEPATFFLCGIRWWFFGFGMVVLSGGVFARSYQLKKIHQLVKVKEGEGEGGEVD